LRHVEAVIKLFDPAYDVRTIPARRRYRVNKWFKRGTMGRVILDVLKASPEPLAAKTIAVRLLQTKGHAEPAPQDVSELERCVRSAIRHSLARHLLADGGRPVRWRFIQR